MTFPLHVPGTPTVHTVATLGWNVLHALFHILDAVNRASFFAPYRRLKGWHNASLSALSVSGSIPYVWVSDSPESKMIAFFTPFSSYQRKEQCYRVQNQALAKYDTGPFNYSEEILINVPALTVVAESFEFLERVFGRHKLKSQWPYPEIYWVGAMMPFCSVTFFYKERKQGQTYLKALTNAMLKELRYNFSSGFGCSENSPMLQHKCPNWSD